MFGSRSASEPRAGPAHLQLSHGVFAEHPALGAVACGMARRAAAERLADGVSTTIGWVQQEHARLRGNRAVQLVVGVRRISLGS